MKKAKGVLDLSEKEQKVQKALGTLWPTYEGMAKDKRSQVTYVRDTYMGIPYEIRKGAASPWCYIQVPEVSAMRTADYDSIDLDVHGGLTYGNDEGWEGWVGWDHTHSGDLSFFELKYKEYGGFGRGGKRYSFPELIDECKDACKQMVKLLSEEGIIFNNLNWEKKGI